MKFMNVATDGDKDLQTLIEVMIGNMLTGKNFAASIFILGYAPRSGKSTILNFIERIVGPENVGGLEFERFSDKFSLSSITNAKYNVCADVNPKITPKATASLKRISGNDTLVIEEKTKQAYSSHLNLPLVFSTNTQIDFGKMDGGLLRRIVAIPFNRSVDDQTEIPDLLEFLMLERDYIMSRCVNKFGKSLKASCLPYSQKSIDAKEEWVQDSIQNKIPISVSKFVAKKVEITRDDNDTVSSKELYSHYLEYCDKKDLEPLVYSVFCREFKGNYQIKDVKKRCKEENKKIHHACGVKLLN